MTDFLLNVTADEIVSFAFSLARKGIVKFDGNGNYASFTVLSASGDGGQLERHRVRSKVFRLWLLSEFYRGTNRVPARSVMRAAIDMLEALNVDHQLSATTSA